ncbi:MAG: hypothetical protein ABJF86_18635 [Tateyamaria sp.]|uniref:hypothetical protein n=1 Tax=Tateyamaria sp. TaxID=1929288 RepID=UPI0032697854
MKWLSLALGIVFLLISWLIVQVAKGYAFAYGGFEEWNAEFINQYNACCLMTDLKSVAPFALVGVVCIIFAVWKFWGERSERSPN